MLSETTPPKDIVWLGAAELARQIAAGQLTSTEVVEAHIRRIQATHLRLNALVVPLFDQARRDAEAADRVQKQGRLLGPLHGVPFTAKECFFVAGTSATIGIARLASDLASQDAPAVASLRKAGGILLGKTNVSQLMLYYESDNPVYGRTNNPWDKSRSPGGSTGGEAALIAAGGSPLGLGTDLGGSIRQPAHSCGIQGFLPTPGRLTTEGLRWNLGALKEIAVQPGVMARTIEDLQLGMSVLCGMTPTDRPLDGLRLAMWQDDGYFSTSPAICRAVRDAAAICRSQGAIVEEIVPPDAREAARLFFGFLSADGGDSFRQLLGSSPRDWRIQRLLRLSSLPRWLRPGAARVVRWTGRKRLAEVLEVTGYRTPEERQQLLADMDRFVSQFLTRLRQGRFDAILCPPHALPALRHGAGDRLPIAASYCFLMNVAGLPCGVVAASKIRPSEESDRPASRDPADAEARRVEQGSAGLPVGVQVAALPGQDELVLSLLATLEREFARSPNAVRLSEGVEP